MTLPDIVASLGLPGFAGRSRGGCRLDAAPRTDSFKRLFEYCAGVGDTSMHRAAARRRAAAAGGEGRESEGRARAASDESAAPGRGAGC
ncbi:MAG: hypothetical protein ACHP91_07620, partial [Burkholderiales bacterium]